MNKQKLSEVAEFEIQELLGIGLLFVVFGIAITYGVVVQSDVRAEAATTATCPTGMILNTSNSVTGSTACNVAGANLNASYPGNVSAVTDRAAYDAGTDSVNATGKLASKQGLIVTVVVAAIIIGILLRYLYVGLFSQ